ncbi:HpcH/HpaI aldolase/citrate lyase family protein [Piscinibacter sp.]|uniref:HpcH/HpaI aldolase/citrate lyase family protein n=1 Tax=Piscinibacter sp. TaxID=1903157 RepID=UPI002C889B1B|nr:CoA ester lyase [Albitalea sp.]HUG25031.1 CoA ester lyase [Albitalea sp.]
MTRSYLFVPGDRPERFDKARAAGAGQVILDLEDAVAPDTKARARDAVANWLHADRPVALRINGAGTRWFDDDLALAAHPGVAAVMLPKAEDADTLARVAAAAPQAALLPLVETALGIAAVDAIARAPRVQRLVFGSIDFQLDLGIEGDGDELLFFRSQLVLASRLAELAPPVDGVCTALDDIEALRAASLRARRLGFGAKLCIHPRQVGVVEAAFAPGEGEIAWARRVVDAAAGANGAAVAVDGRMVDRPVLLRAQRRLQ